MEPFIIVIKPPNLSIVRWYFILALIEGIGVLYWLLLIPERIGSGGLMGLSFGRLALITPLIIIVFTLSWIVIHLWLRPADAERWAQNLSAFTLNDLAYWATIAIAGTICVIGINFLGTRNSEPFMQAYLVRLAPYSAYFVLFCVQTLFLIRVLRFGWSLKVFRPYRGIFLASLVAFGIILVLAGIVLWTRIGLKPDIVAWGAPGVPLLPSQVWLALAITLAGLFSSSLAVYLWEKQCHDSPLRLPPRVIDSLICILLWTIAVWRWNAEPLKTSYFAPDPTPPNLEYYPFSDAGNYDLSAQELLVGAKFELDVMRPIYSLFLALAQSVSGVGYQNIIPWQLALLGLIPPLLYLLAKAIHHPISGFLLSLLVIFHESNSLALTGIINVSNVKMLMSDLPTSLGVILFSLVVVLWLQKPGQRRIYPFLAGGILGVFMLVRVQIAFVLLAALVCAWLVLRQRPVSWLKCALVLLVGLLLTLSPWLYRNWQMTGKIILAGTTNISQAGLLGQRYNQSLETGISSRLPEETDDEYLSRMAGSALKYASAHPLEAASFITAHFWHNQVATLLVLPSSFPVLTGQQLPQEGLSNLKSAWSFLRYQCCSPHTYVRELPYWWSDWQGAFLPESWLPLLSSIFLIAVGIGAAWQRARFVGLLPLFVTITYSFSNALVRNSGWRFNLPVDWIGIMYYAIGLVQVCFWIWTFFKNRFVPLAWEAGITSPHGADQEKPFPWKQAAAAGFAFILLVGAIPLAEHIIPARYTPAALQMAVNSLTSEASSQQLDLVALQGFLSSKNSTALVGRAMYPRFYSSGDGIPRSGWPSYAVREYPRLSFVLVGAETNPVILPEVQPPTNFPNAADVFVLGCQREDYIDARLVMLLNAHEVILLASPSPTWNCISP